MGTKSDKPRKTWVGLYPRKTKTKKVKNKSIENKHKKNYAEKSDE